jgi:hypothetical protein
MFSTDNDNDVLSFIISMITDGDGVEHTLSLCATTGGVLLDLDPSFVLGDPSTSTILYQNTVASWALVYDFGKSGCTQLLNFNTTKSGFDWGDVEVGDLDFKVIRSADQITIDVDWTIDAVAESNTFNFNLNDNVLTEKFLGFNQIGFGFMSQESGGFKDVVIEIASVDYWGELKMTPVDSPDQRQTITIDTEFEQTEDNELIQLNGTDVLASIDWVDPSFLLRAKVNPNKFNAGTDYNVTGEIGLKNNIV